MTTAQGAVRTQHCLFIPKDCESLGVQKVKVKVSAARLHPTLCDPMDCSPPGSSVHGISQARILPWVAISFSRRSSWTRYRLCVSWTGRWIIYSWVTREALGIQRGQLIRDQCWGGGVKYGKIWTIFWDWLTIMISESLPSFPPSYHDSSWYFKSLISQGSIMDLNAFVRLQKAFDMTKEPVFIIIKWILDSPQHKKLRQTLPLFLYKCEPITDFMDNFSDRTTAKNNPGLGFRRPWCIPPNPQLWDTEQ